MAKKTLPSLPDEALLDWLQLSRSENVGPLTFRRLLQRYKTPSKALAALPDLASRGGLKRPLKLISRVDVEEELTSTRRFGADIITLEDPSYPPLLRHIDSAPPVITVKGRLDLLQNPLFAIVGARNASALGKKMAYQLAGSLGQQKWIIASGLARGIDGAAHEGSLGQGTVAILAGGIDQVYPIENQKLYDRIGEEGVLLAESAFGVPPQPALFPRRNRIISGISRCVLVVEAALKSGSLITARYALEQGRDVFAIPGHPLDPRARGCNQLIKNGAILVETIEDIQGEITAASPLMSDYITPFVLSVGSEGAEVEGWHEKENYSSFDFGAPHLSLEARTVFSTETKSCQSTAESIKPSSLEFSRSLIKENLSYVPISIDELIRECQLSASEVRIVLLEMEIAGCLERLPGGKVSLKKEWKSL